MCRLKWAVVHAVWLTLLLAGGCVVSDKITTFTVHPNGSADLVVVCSNIRSTQKGEEADKEMSDYREKFDDRSAGEMARITESGGEIRAQGWVCEQVPSANYLHAHFPDAAALEKFGTIQNEKGESLVEAHFESKGKTRRLTIRITGTEKKGAEEAAPADVQQLRQKLADGISETRIAVTDGSITSARGFTVAEDKQSALLDMMELAKLLHQGEGQAELYLEWEVAQ